MTGVFRHKEACKAYLSKLIDPLAGVVCMHALVLCTKVPPLEAIDWPQVPNFPVNKVVIASHHAYLHCLSWAQTAHTKHSAKANQASRVCTCIVTAQALCGCLLACQ